MSLNYLLEEYREIPKVKIIGKELVIDDIIYEVVGLTLKDKQLELLMLEYDGEYQNRIRALEEDEEYTRTRETNRIIQRNSILENKDSVLHALKEVYIDGVCYNTNGASGEGFRVEDSDKLFLLSKLFAKGYKPKSLGDVYSEHIYMNSIRLEGEFTKFSEISKNPEVIIKRGYTADNILVEKPITLEVGKEYTEKIYFDVDGEKRWIFINSVEPYDILSRMLEQFKDPRYLEHYTKEQLDKLVKDVTENIKQQCPDGKNFVVIEYETENDDGVRFFLKSWLDSEPQRSNKAMMFAARPDKNKPFGKLGKQLHIELLAEPFDIDVKSIDTELFSYFKKRENKDLVF